MYHLAECMTQSWVNAIRSSPFPSLLLVLPSQDAVIPLQYSLNVKLLAFESRHNCCLAGTSHSINMCRPYLLCHHMLVNLFNDTRCPAEQSCGVFDVYHHIGFPTALVNTLPSAPHAVRSTLRFSLRFLSKFYTVTSIILYNLGRPLQPTRNFDHLAVPF